MARSIRTKSLFKKPALPILVGLFAIVGAIVITFASASTVVGDINNDGKIDVFDLSGLLAKWGTADTAADLNHDGTVNIFDLSLLLSHWGQTVPTTTPSTTAVPSPSPTPTPGTIASASNPCVGAAAPAKWKHVVVLFFENKYYGDVIGNSSAPFINGLASHCAVATNFLNSEYDVTGQPDGTYDSKPSYATFMTGLPPTAHGITVDDYGATSNADNMFNRLNQMGLDAKSYQSGGAGQCNSSNFEGAYHDPMRYFTDLGAQSADPTTYCNTHDVSINSFITDVNSGKLPAFSIIIPTNNQNMHNNDVASGDAWANNFLTPFLNSAQYKSGDTALFFMWDEHTPIPNVLVAPSIKPGIRIGNPTSGNPVTDYSATRTWQEMLGVSPLLGVSGQAPSFLNVYNGQ